MPDSGRLLHFPQIAGSSDFPPRISGSALRIFSVGHSHHLIESRRSTVTGWNRGLITLAGTPHTTAWGGPQGDECPVADSYVRHHNRFIADPHVAADDNNAPIVPCGSYLPFVDAPCFAPEDRKGTGRKRPCRSPSLGYIFISTISMYFSVMAVNLIRVHEVLPHDVRCRGDRGDRIEERLRHPNGQHRVFLSQ